MSRRLTLDQLRASRDRLTDIREAAIRELTRTDAKIRKINLQIARAKKAATKRLEAETTAWHAANPPAQYVPPPAEITAIEDQLEVPEFLRRSIARGAPDIEAAAQIKAEQEEKRLTKSRNRIATMKAKKAGDTKKMPLSGRAALAFIDRPEQE